MSVLFEDSVSRSRQTVSQTGRSYCDTDDTTHAQREAGAGVGDGGFWEDKEVDMYSAHGMREQKKIAEQHR
jgi:hypothetical protein